MSKVSHLLALVVFIVTIYHGSAFTSYTPKLKYAHSQTQIRPTSTSLYLSSNKEITSKTVVVKGTEEIEPAETSWKESPGLWRGVILGLCLAYSSQFSVIKMVYSGDSLVMDPSLYSAIRFSICGLIFLPKIIETMKDPELFFRCLAIGVVVSIGYVGQSVGLVTSTAGSAAFIASLSTIWVALFESAKAREFKLQTWVSVALAVSGTALLELSGQKEFGATLWLVLMPIGFGTGVILLSDVCKRYPDDPDKITSVKLGSAAVCCNIWAASNGHSLAQLPLIMDNPQTVFGILYTSLFTTAFAVWVQSRAFKRVSATDATIIFSSEPVWASIFAFFSLGEVLTVEEAAGAALIIAAGLSNEFKVVERIRERLSAD